ncbi:NlpC/P60 family protein [Arthrobacter sp. AFG7.2]|uniref:NlpC/P60 family protein n=1 Tax=Arthrobacter sp. AFG7.2 TaxID=1688693 RepID=UPI001670EDDE|nr:NlpC/P60 family protein [Arthrobacter sp. AFG7.2]
MLHIFARLGGALAVLGLLIPTTTSFPTNPEEYVVTEKSGTSQAEVYDNAGEWIATFTYGAQTVALAGPQRTFTEPGTTAAVVSSIHVRLLPEPFTGAVDQHWLRSAVSDTSPDLLDMAMQYVSGAPDIRDEAGLRIAGDAGYGASSADGTLQEGADFNDYLGIRWDYAGKSDAPEANELKALDCSGYIRMLFGYRGGMGMTLSPAPGLLPRRSFQMLENAPGTLVHKSTGQLKTFDGIQPGDLVFFDAEADTAGQIDHVGMFLGADTAGKNRFISSRKSSNGPTLGDAAARSILDGTGYYAKALRGVRRL